MGEDMPQVDGVISAVGKTGQRPTADRNPTELAQPPADSRQSHNTSSSVGLEATSGLAVVRKSGGCELGVDVVPSWLDLAFRRSMIARAGAIEVGAHATAAKLYSDHGVSRSSVEVLGLPTSRAARPISHCVLRSQRLRRGWDYRCPWSGT